MSGSKSGGLKAAETNKRKFGDNFYKEIGKLGGAASSGYKFGHGKVNPREVGAIGGRNGKPYSRKPRPGRELEWSVSDDSNLTIAEAIAEERRKSWRERLFG